MDEEEEEVNKEQELKLTLLDRKKTSSKGYFIFYGFSFLIKKINDVKQGFILNFVVSFNNFLRSLLAVFSTLVLTLSLKEDMIKL